MSTLRGKRVLVVEDEFLISLVACDLLEDMGAIPVGPAASVAQGMVLVDEGGLDAAVLDVNLNGQQSEPLARILFERGVPVLIASGQALPAWASPGTPLLGKPYTPEDFSAHLEALLSE
jgi:DNA-binding response OmpR family regulator